MTEFTPLASFAGGVLIGLAASALLFFAGRIAGISGIVGGLLQPVAGDVGWRAAFVGGLLAGGVVLRLADPASMAVVVDRPLVVVAVAGLLVGFGTRLGNGCTSGHGVCGVSRGSPRSLAATAVFMACGIATVALTQRLLAGMR